MSEVDKKLLVARAAVWKSPQKELILVGQRLRKKDDVKEGEKFAKNYPNRWEFPGGKVDKGEIPYITATREVTEETGLRVERVPFVTFFHHYLLIESEELDSKYFGYFISTHMIEALAQNPEALLQVPPEHQKLEWITLDEAENRNLMPQSSFALPYLRDIQREAQKNTSYFVMDWTPVRTIVPAEVR